MLRNTTSSTVIQSPGEIEKKNAYLACNIFTYARARKLLLDKVKQIQKLQRQIQLRKIIIGQIDNLTG
jgi:hypothetical protein